MSSEIALPLISSSDVNNSDISDTLRDICKRTLFHLNAVQRCLSYWQIKHDGLDSLWNSVSLTDYTPRNPVSLQGKWTVVAIRVLLKLRYHLFVFLSQGNETGLFFIRFQDSCLFVYTELELGRNAHDLITHLDAHFSTLSESVTSIGLGSLAFESLAELNFFNGVVLSKISENLAKIDMFFPTLISRYEKPKNRISGKWICFAVIGAIGISLASICHTSSSESSKFSFMGALRYFLHEHVKKPLKGIRNAFFARPEVVHDNEVREAASELQSMVAKFVKVESTANTAEKEIVELVERRVTSVYDHPIRSFRNGDLYQAGLIKYQKIWVDYETVKFEIMSFYKSNKLSLALLSAAPAYYAIKGLIWAFHKCGKVALQVIERDRSQSRTLLAMVKIAMAEFVQHPPQQSQQQQRQYLHGVLLYLLDKFCMRVEKHARITAEWDTVRQDVIEVSRFMGERLPKAEAMHRLRKYRCIHA